MREVDVIIPTYRRPESLARAVRSVMAQASLSDLVSTVVVVDNDPMGSARDTVDALRALCPVALVYVHAREPGVSNARNAGLAAASAPLVAFLDDDEEAPEGWLRALRTVHLDLGADVTFGPVRGRADVAASWKRPYLEAFFSRTGPERSGLIDQPYGCGCSMMTRATALMGDAPFDPGANQTGGEDDRLFQRLKTEGRRFGWAADAWVYEHAAPERQTARYALARGFGYGQSPAQLAARQGRWAEVAFWMAVGAVQALVFATAALGLALVSPARGLVLADRAARGLGKVFWFWTLRFYGRPARQSASKAPRAKGSGSVAAQASAPG